jgi:hypothetical protein
MMLAISASHVNIRISRVSLRGALRRSNLYPSNEIATPRQVGARNDNSTPSLRGWLSQPNQSPKGEILNPKGQILNKSKNDESHRRNVARGSSCPPYDFGRRVSLVPERDCTTLKGRTTVVSGI